MNPSKPLELFIVETAHSFFVYEDEPTALNEVKSQSVRGPAKAIRVIEHAAYTALLAEAEALRNAIANSYHGVQLKDDCAICQALKRFDKFKEGLCSRG